MPGMIDRGEHESEASGPSDVPAENAKAKRKRRTARPFPATSFFEALFLAEAIQKHGAGQRTRHLTLFEALDRC
jgi:hypothetical protein